MGKINPTTHVIRYFTTLLAGYGITAGPDGNLWFAADYGNYTIGVINPTTFATSGFSLSAFGPYGVTAGPDGNVWFAEPKPAGQIGQINPTTDAITEYPVPYSGSAPYAITTGPDGNLWFVDNGTTRSASRPWPPRNWW